MTLLMAAALAAVTSQAPGPDPVARAVTYLAAEVPRWRREHPCYSCHNNGDAARALLAATRRGHAVGGALDDTLAWIATPERWDQNARRGGSEELPLARIQFAGALASMFDAGRASSDAVDRAASMLVSHQQRDGAWHLSESQILGGATSYGTALATAAARRVLARANASSMAAAVSRANQWLRARRIETVLEASSVLYGLDTDADADAARQRRRCLEILKQAQGPDGGWGPYVTSQSEPFDSALALLAMAPLMTRPQLASPVYADAELRTAIQRARRYLTGAQNDDGSWTETTRPPGQESYAQRISTTAWSLLALLESQ
jgi:squalene cyclase